PHLAAPRAGSARSSCLSGRHARAMALLASFMPPNRNLLGDSEDRLLELQREVLAQIGSALGGAGTPASAAEEIFKAHAAAEPAEDLLKQIERIDSYIACPGRAAHPSVPEAVVSRALLRVAQHGVSFANLFEAFFGFRSLGFTLMGVLIRVILDRQPPIGRLDLLLGTALWNSEHFVV